MAYRTNQELFDAAAEHMLKQNMRSTDSCFFCVYRGEDGLKCAVGALIPDEAYIPEIEENTVSGLFAEFPEVMEKSGIDVSSVETENLLKDLQNAHDFAPVSEWRDRLKVVAETHGLLFNLKG